MISFHISKFGTQTYPAGLPKRRKRQLDTEPLSVEDGLAFLPRLWLYEMKVKEKEKILALDKIDLEEKKKSLARDQLRIQSKERKLDLDKAILRSVKEDFEEGRNIGH